jgi:hypothetical protein
VAAAVRHGGGSASDSTDATKKVEIYNNPGFIAFGRGVKKSVTLGTIRLVDVAPTAAKLLELDFEGTDGRVLTEILQ